MVGWLAEVALLKVEVTLLKAGVALQKVEVALLKADVALQVRW